LPPDLIGDRGLRLPVGQDLVEPLAILVVLLRPGHLRADLPALASREPDLLGELVGQAHRDALHAIIMLR
jgi:hypothetical protein